MRAYDLLALRPGGPLLREHPPWLLGSPITAGPSRSCCRFMSRRRAGHPRHNVGVPRMRSNASWSGGAGTTVRCGPTRPGSVIIQATKDVTVQTVQKAADIAVQAGSKLDTDAASSYRAVTGYTHES